MDQSVLAIQRKRFQFLKELYEATKGDTLAYENMNIVGRNAGIEESEITPIMWYLKERGLLALITYDGGVGLTHAGVNEVEAALTQPAIATPHFPPATVMNINVQQMTNSQIQQGTQGSTLNVTYGANNIAAVTEFVRNLHALLPQLGLEADEQEIVAQDIERVERQLASPQPKWAIIRSGLHSLQPILQGAAGNVAAAGLLDGLHQLLH